MADFDAIYEDIQDEDPVPPPNLPKMEPFIIRGTGNMTVYVWLFQINFSNHSILTFIGSSKISIGKN